MKTVGSNSSKATSAHGARPVRAASPERQRVLMLVWPEPGHYSPLFALARELERAGLAPQLLGDETTAEVGRNNGLDVVDLLSELGVPASAGVDTAAFQRQIKAHLAAFIGFVRERRPALVVLDSLYWTLTLILTRHGFCCAHASTALPDEYDPSVPPWSSHHVPELSWRSALVRRAHWLHMRWQQAVVGSCQRLGLPVLRGIPRDVHHLGDVGGKLAEAAWPRGWAEARGFHKPSLGVPELVLCPAAFEYPFKRARRARAYVEACVDLERVEDERCLVTLDESRPLVVVSLGSQAARYTQRERVEQAVLEAARRRPQYDFLVAAGVDGAIREWPANVRHQAYLPQLAALKRASAMVTHGGLGAVKECITFGVPLCVIPFGFDQPSVAARVAYHGIGVVLRRERVDAAGLMRALDELVERPLYRARVVLMQASFREVAASKPAVRAICGLVDARARPRAP